MFNVGRVQLYVLTAAALSLSSEASVDTAADN